MNKYETVEIKNVHVTTKSTYTTDCYRKIKDSDGVVTVKRWVQDMSIGANLQAVGKSIFHNGARIA